MDVTLESLRSKVLGYEAILNQLRRTYSNPEMHAVIGLALEGRFDDAIYTGFRNYREIRRGVDINYIGDIELEGDGGDMGEEIPGIDEALPE